MTTAISAYKQRILDACRNHWMTGRVDAWAALGIPLVIGKREGYRMWDVDGHELLDFHLNGGTFNLGHRNPVLVQEMIDAVGEVDIGNHHFPSAARALLAEKLAEYAPGDMPFSVHGCSGSDAVELAIRTARRFTGRRKVVAFDVAYHGRIGVSGQLGDDRGACYFLSEDPENALKMPFGDLEAAGRIFASNDLAAAIVETSPATAGFLVPPPGYLPGLKALCETYGALYIADEVQTGLGRTGCMWGVQYFGVQPDILAIGKGLTGGLYPISATVMTAAVAGWLRENPWGFVSTSGGADIGCRIGARVLDMCGDPTTLAHARMLSDYLFAGLSAIRTRDPFLCEIRRIGLVMALKFDDPQGAMKMMKALYDAGLWAIFAGFDESVLQFKPGLLLDTPTCDEALGKVEAAMQVAKNMGGAAAGFAPRRTDR